MKTPILSGREEKLALCRYCKSELNPNANVCIECDRFQDWRRFLSFSSTLLALCIALISVLTALGPSLIALFERAHNEMIFSVVEHKSGTFRVAARNVGNREAVVGSVEIGFHQLGFYPLALEGPSRTVQAGQTKVFTVIIPEEAYPNVEYGLRHFHWADSDSSDETPVDHVPRSGNLLALEVLESDGCKQIYTSKIPKPLFETFLGTIFPRRNEPSPEIPEPDSFEGLVTWVGKIRSCETDAG